MIHVKPVSYLAVPDSGRGRGVLVLHAWWGLNDTIKAFCDRLARAGFTALAPDLFSGTVAESIEQAEQHLSSWDEAQAVPPILLPEVENFSSHPAASGSGLRVVGFSLGAYWALWLAQQQPKLIRAVTLFYGTDGGDGNYRQSEAEFQGHFAENDPYEPLSTVDQLEQNLRSAGRPVSFYRYPGTGHWFFEPDRPQAFNQPAADLAWERTLDFLRSIN